MSVVWGSVEADDTAWEEAKVLLGITDVRRLSTPEFREVIALATEIKAGRVNLAAK